jgi:alkanesulfonate monooxygenase SsuD/methylene tetrahydromethanopterin reductase-like flavin-dependent oxidoreductase (luciferase family)
MRFGVFLNLFFQPGEEGSGAGMAAVVEQARACEQAGFDWVVLGERHHHKPGYHEILSSATWLAAHTERIGIATAGIILPLYQPVPLAEYLAHLDQLSGGRLTPGFVLGYRPEEFAAVEVDRGERLGRFEESLMIIKQLWLDGRTSFDGKFHRLDEVLISPMPAQRPRPSIWNGGRVPAAIKRTAALCDGWTTSFNEDLSSLVPAIELYRAQPPSADSLGRDVIMLREGFCAPTTQQARATLEAPLRSLYASYTDWKRDSIDVGHYEDFDWGTVRGRAVVGSPAEVVDAIGRYRDIGSDAVVLRVQPPTLPHADAMRCIELLANEVLPQFR